MRILVISMPDADPDLVEPIVAKYLELKVNIEARTYVAGMEILVEEDYYHAVCKDVDAAGLTRVEGA